MMVLTWLYISTSDNLKALFIPNREERVKLFLRNEKSPQKYRKNNNAANYIEIFNIPTMLVVIVFQIHDTYKRGILFGTPRDILQFKNSTIRFLYDFLKCFFMIPFY
jgi:hypothetical protein